MVRCWYVKEHSFEERFEPNYEQDGVTLTLDELHTATGALYWKIDADNYESEGKLEQIRSERGYSYKDEVTISSQAMGAVFNDKQRMFFSEHFHSDEEIRFVLDGEGYFDLRENQTGKWIRIFVEKGDLLVVPAGEYHRFALTEKQSIHVVRLFIGEPVWTAINRSTEADAHPARVSYVSNMKVAVN